MGGKKEKINIHIVNRLIRANMRIDGLKKTKLTGAWSARSLPCIFTLYYCLLQFLHSQEAKGGLPAIE